MLRRMALACVLAGAGIGPALATDFVQAQRLALEAMLARKGDADRRAPVDYGYGLDIAPPAMRAGPGAAAAARKPAEQPPAGDALAGTDGMFAAPMTWPIIGLHAILLPDGRVMSYGTNQNGVQGAQLIYDVWDPSLGTDPTTHLTLPNTTQTDIFCSGQSMIWSTGQVLITGGDLTINKQRNFSNNHTTIFDPPSNTLSPGGTMQYARWYPSVIAQPNGEMLILGGRAAPTQFTATPEIYNPVTGWRTLTGAASTAAFGDAGTATWYYPRGFLMPDGNVYVVDYLGNFYMVTTAGSGSITQLPLTIATGSYAFPTVMYAPGKLLSLRAGARSVTIDFNGTAPVVAVSGKLSQNRFWSNATVLADGTVLASGGSAGWNTLDGVAFQPELWNPMTGVWTLGAAGQMPRLYHSTALMLPDGSVLITGGGAPGPVTNLNAELYYPPYLYANDGSGQPAIRPSLTASVTVAAVGQSFAATVGTTDKIARVTFVRTGSVTHSQNPDQRFMDLAFSQNKQRLQITLPSSPTIVLPGYYLMFAINQAGTPSLGQMILVPSPS